MSAISTPVSVVKQFPSSPKTLRCYFTFHLINGMWREIPGIKYYKVRLLYALEGRVQGRRPDVFYSYSTFFFFPSVLELFLFCIFIFFFSNLNFYNFSVSLLNFSYFSVSLLNFCCFSYLSTIFSLPFLPFFVLILKYDLFIKLLMHSSTQLTSFSNSLHIQLSDLFVRFTLIKMFCFYKFLRSYKYFFTNTSWN